VPLSLCVQVTLHAMYSAINSSSSFCCSTLRCAATNFASLSSSIISTSTLACLNLSAIT